MLSLSPEAARALEIARREGTELRFTLLEHCHTGRFRLAVRYVVADDRSGERRDVNLGLVWSEDRGALEALKAELEGTGAPPG